MIDEDQMYAENLVKILYAYYDEVNLGFLDEKAEFIKILRHEWDVLIFNRAYDLTLTDVVGIIQEQNVELPIIELVKSEEAATINEFGYAELISGNMIKSLVVGQDDRIVMAICLQADFIKSKRQTQNLRNILREAEQRANILIKNSKSAVAYIDQGVHIYANDPYLEMFGYDSIEEIIGVPVVDLFASGDDVKGFKQFLSRFSKGDRKQVEFNFESKRTDGSTFASKLQLAAATLEGEPVTQMIIQQNKVGDAELIKKLAEAERQDVLTGLYNRLAFDEMLSRAYRQVINGDSHLASLLYVRMDNMGKISSSTGLTGVDASIKQISYLLSEHFDKVDATVCRFGDTSFTVLIHDINQEEVVKLAQLVCQKASSLLIEVGSRTVTTSLSIGIVMIDVNSPEPQTILERAIDTAHDIDPEGEPLDKVKVFDISQIASEDEELMGEYLKNALTNNTLKLSYQPIYDIEADNNDLFEVYVTLPQADGTLMTLEKIAPIAKKHGLCMALDRWVLINACKNLAMVRKMHANTRLLISLSSASLEDSALASNVTKLVQAIGGGSDVVSLQFNEQELIDYMAIAKRQFIALQNINCRLGVYSFGSTAKSLEVLEHLAPATARLARSYTKDLHREDNLNALKSLVDSANERHVGVLMPYIEDPSTMSTAWSIGVKFLQGNYLQPADSQIVYAPPAEA